MYKDGEDVGEGSRSIYGPTFGDESFSGPMTCGRHYYPGQLGTTRSSLSASLSLTLSLSLTHSLSLSPFPALGSTRTGPSGAGSGDAAWPAVAFLLP